MDVSSKIALLEGTLERYDAEVDHFNNWIFTVNRQLDELFPNSSTAKEFSELRTSYVQHSQASNGGVHIPHYGVRCFNIIERQLQQLYMQEDVRYLVKPCYPKELNDWYRNIRRERDVLHNADIKLTGWFDSILEKIKRVSSVKGITGEGLKNLQQKWNDEIAAHNTQAMNSANIQLRPLAIQEVNDILRILKAEIIAQIQQCDAGETLSAGAEYKRRTLEITDEIKSLPDVYERLKEFKHLRSKAKSAYSKYKRLLPKYQFLNTIILPKILYTREEDDNLEFAVRDLLNSIGFKSHVPLNKDDFDVISTFKDVKLGIEVKNGNLPPENDMFQALKYNGRSNDSIHPIIIWNNATTKQEFDKPRIGDAEKHNYGIMTTRELHKGYLKLKHGKITFEKFLNQLQKTGLIKFSSKALGKPTNGDAAR